MDILRTYYGDNIEIVTNAPVQGLVQSYPGTALRRGSTGPNVVVVQTSLNRVGQNYPAIPKISPVDGSSALRRRTQSAGSRRFLA